jgi:hypothetical protein
MAGIFTGSIQNLFTLVVNPAGELTGFTMPHVQSPRLAPIPIARGKHRGNLLRTLPKTDITPWIRPMQGFDSISPINVEISSSIETSNPVRVTNENGQQRLETPGSAEGLQSLTRTAQTKQTAAIQPRLYHAPGVRTPSITSGLETGRQ